MLTRTPLSTSGADANLQADEATVSVIVLLLNLLCIGGYVAAFAGVVMSSWRSRRRKRVREVPIEGCLFGCCGRWVWWWCLRWMVSLPR